MDIKLFCVYKTLRVLSRETVWIMYLVVCLPLAKFGLKSLGQDCEQIHENHTAWKNLTWSSLLAPVSKEKNLQIIQERRLLIRFLWHIPERESRSCQRRCLKRKHPTPLSCCVLKLVQCEQWWEISYLFLGWLVPWGSLPMTFQNLEDFSMLISFLYLVQFSLFKKKIIVLIS